MLVGRVTVTVTVTITWITRLTLTTNQVSISSIINILNNKVRNGAREPNIAAILVNPLVHFHLGPGDELLCRECRERSKGPAGAPASAAIPRTVQV